MNRRNFICVAGVAAAQVAFAPVRLLATPSRKIEYLDEISPNYRAFREAHIKIMKQGYTIRWGWLERPVDGFRRATMHVTDETGTEDAHLVPTLEWGRIDE